MSKCDQPPRRLPRRDDHFTMIPNEVLDYAIAILGLAQFKVYMFILRQTIGFHRPDTRITLDEFEFGRKNKEGDRLSFGCGLSRKSIRKAISELVELRMIRMSVDDRDLGRIKRQFGPIYEEDEGNNCLKINKVTPDEGNKVTPDEGNKVTPDEGNKVTPNGLLSFPRTEEIKTKEKKRGEIKKRKDVARRSAGPTTPSRINGTLFEKIGIESTKQKQEDKFSYKAAKKLGNALAAKGKLYRIPSLPNWSKQIDKFLSTTSVTKEHFKDTLRWYISNIGEPFVPEAFSADSFCKKFVQIESSRRREEVDRQGNGDSDSVVEGVLKRFMGGNQYD
jgi:hypothetical protein